MMKVTAPSGTITSTLLVAVSHCSTATAMVVLLERALVRVYHLVLLVVLVVA